LSTKKLDDVTRALTHERLPRRILFGFVSVFRNIIVDFEKYAQSTPTTELTGQQVTLVTHTTTQKENYSRKLNYPL
jgi:hypothetical protein